MQENKIVHYYGADEQYWVIAFPINIVLSIYDENTNNGCWVGAYISNNSSVSHVKFIYDLYKG